MSGGRPSKYLPSYCDEVIAVMGGEGLSLTAFAGDIGVARSTINEWIDNYPEFSEACKIGQAKRTAHLERGLLSAEVGPRVTARVFALKNADPDGWRDKTMIVGGDKDDAPIRHEHQIEDADAFTRAIAGVAARSGEARDA